MKPPAYVAPQGSLAALRQSASRIALYAALVAITLLAIGLVSARYRTLTRENEELAAARATERASALAGLLSESIAATLRQADTLHGLAHLLTQARLAGDTEAEARLRALIGQPDGIGGPDVALVAAVTPEGRILWSNLNWTSDTDVSDRPSFIALQNNPKISTLFSDPIMGRLTGEHTLQYVRALRGPAGELQEITLLALRVDMLARLSRDIDFSPDDRVLLLREDGTVLMRRTPELPDGPASRQAVPRSHIAPPTMPGQHLAARPSPLDGVPRYVAERPIPGQALTLHVGLSQPAQMAALAGVAETLWHWTLLLDALILASAIAAGCYLLLLRRNTVAAARTAAALRNEAWFRSVIDGMDDGVIVIDNLKITGGRISFANRRAGEVFATTDDAMVGGSMADWLDPTEFPRLAEWRARLAQGQSMALDIFRAIRRDGQPIWISGSAVSVADLLNSGQTRVILTVRDVTEQQGRDAALAEARARIDRMLEVIPGVFFQLSPDAQGAFRVTYISESVNALFGVSVATAMQPGYLSNLSGVDLAATRRAALLQAGPGGVAETQYEVPLHGRHYWIRELLRATAGPDGRPIVIGFMIDATAEHTADLARRAAEAAARRQNWALNAYSRALPTLLRAGPLRDLMDRVCEEIVAEPTFIIAGVAVPQPDKTVRIMAAAGPAKSYLDGVSITWDDGPNGQGPTGRAIRTGAPQILGDATNSPSFAPWRERAMAFGMRCSMSMPCLIDGRVVAVLIVYGSEPNTFQDEVLEVFHRLAEEIGLAITIEQDRGRLHAAEQSLRDSARLGPGLLYRARIEETRAELVDVVGEHERVTAGIAGPDGSPASLACIIGAPEPLAAMRALEVDATGSEDFAVPGLDGTTRWIRNSVRMVGRAGAGVIDVVGYISEVTHEKQQQLQRQQLTTLLTLGEMATGLAHELNQPLASISFTAENAGLRLGMTPPDVPGALQRIVKITNEVQRASRLIDHMRIFARNEHEAVRPVCWRATLESALEILQPKLIGFRLTTDLPDDLPHVAGAPIPMEQVLINLVANAVDAYGPPADPRPREIAIVGRHHDGQVALQVRDKAGGIPAPVLPRLFEPFFTIKPPGKGTGLGLSLVFGAVVDMGGTITAHNEDGGAVFEVTLPAIEAAVLTDA